MSDFVELHRLINIVLRRWWLLLGFTAIVAALGYGISQRQTPVYEAKVTVLVGETTKSTNLSREDVQLSGMFAQTYADLAVRQPVLQGVVEMLGLDETWEDLKKQVNVSALDGMQLIEIRAEANTPELARSIADEVAKNLILIGPANLSEQGDNFAQSFVQKQMEDTQLRILNGEKRVNEIEEAMKGSISAAKFLELQTEKANLERLIADHVLNYVELSNLAAQDRTPNSLSIIEPAYAEQTPIRPRVNLNILLGAGLGMLLALGVIFLWEFLDDTIKSLDDLPQFKHLNLLGTVGRIKGKKYSEKIITHLAPLSPTAESYRMIRNKIRFGAGDEPIKTIVVTSPGPEEGKSITAANLGVIMAQASIKTILVDADLRRPVLHQAFKVPNRSGLANLLDSPEADINNIIKKTSINNLQLITSGEYSQDQSERLSSERVSEILNRLKEMADLIILDGPPALLVADAAVLTNQAEGVILVLRAGKSKRRAVRQTLTDLQEAKTNLLGCIFNQAHQDKHLAVYRDYKPEKNLIQQLKTRLNIGH